MKICQYCGNQMEDDARFCAKCGLEHAASKTEGEPVDVEPVDIERIEVSLEQDPNAAPPLPDTPVYENVTVNQTPESAPSNNGLVWLILSIILTVCCCSLLQVITIVFSAISMSRYNQGDYEEAKRYAKIAMIVFFSVLALSIIIGIVYFAFTGAVLPDYFNDIMDQYDFT